MKNCLLTVLAFAMASLWCACGGRTHEMREGTASNESGESNGNRAAVAIETDAPIASNGDRDGDNINDDVDVCPGLPETYNDCDDEDGCPERSATRLSAGYLLEDSEIVLPPKSALPMDEVKLAVKFMDYVPGTIEVIGYVHKSSKTSERLAKMRATRLLEKSVKLGIPRHQLRATVAVKSDARLNSVGFRVVDSRFAQVSGSCRRSDPGVDELEKRVAVSRPVTMGVPVYFDIMSPSRARISFTSGEIFDLDRTHDTYAKWDSLCRDALKAKQKVALEWGIKGETTIVAIHPVRLEKIHEVSVSSGKTIIRIAGQRVLTLAKGKPNEAALQQVLSLAADKGQALLLAIDDDNGQILGVHSP